MVKIVFKCLRCGRCCKNLFKELEGALSGLSLSHDEKNLFPNNLVSQQTGIGWGLSGPKHIVNYQLNVNVCPQLSQNNLCKVYYKRPLTCQAFPLTAMGLGISATIASPKDCSFVEETERKKGSLDNLLPMTPKKFRAPKEWQAIAKINRQLRKSFEDNPMDARVLWIFNLKNKEWGISRAF